MRRILLSLAIIQIVIILFWLQRIEFFSQNKKPISSGKAKLFRLETRTMSQKESLKFPINIEEMMQTDKRIEVSDKYNQTTVLMFDSLNNIETVVTKVVFPPALQVMFGFKGMDSLASKIAFVNTLRGTPIIPISYDMTKAAGVKDLVQDFHGPYILKKNIQEQKGLKIITNENELIDTLEKDPGYVVAQKLLDNPLLVSNRKINIRIYLLIIVDPHAKKCDFYIYDNGFIYYSPKRWEENSIENDVHITTGYMKDRSVYLSNPLTYKLLLDTLDDHKRNLLHSNIVNAFSIVKRKYEKELMIVNKRMPCKCVSLMGCDVAPDKFYDVKIMEINKGPDLTYKDENDAKLKLQLIKDIFETTVFDNVTPSFQKII
jgi:hypothetical protein